MTRRGNHADERGARPGWRDVAECLAWLEKTYAGHVEVSMDREGEGENQGAMWVYVKLWAGFAPFGARPVHVARALWPSNTCKEMASLVFRLAHQVDHMADAERRARGDDLPF
jgi:hypothetical protein